MAFSKSEIKYSLSGGCPPEARISAAAWQISLYCRVTSSTDRVARGSKYDRCSRAVASVRSPVVFAPKRVIRYCMLPHPSVLAAVCKEILRASDMCMRMEP